MRVFLFAVLAAAMALLPGSQAKEFDGIIRLNGRSCADKLFYDTGNEIDGSIISSECAARLGYTNSASGDLAVPAGTPEVSVNSGAYVFYCFDNAFVSALDDGNTVCVVTQRVYIPKNATNPAGNQTFRTRSYLNTGWISDARGAMIGAGARARGLWPDKVIARSDLLVTNVVVTNIYITNRFIVSTNGTALTNQVIRNFPFTNVPAWDPWMQGTNYGYPHPYRTNLFPRPWSPPPNLPGGWHAIGTNTYIKVNPDGSTLTVTNANPNFSPTNSITPGTNGWVVAGTNNWILSGTNTVLPYSTNGWRRGTNGWVPLGTNGWLQIYTNALGKWFTNFPGNTNWGGTLRPNTNGYFIDPRDGDFPRGSPYEGPRAQYMRAVAGFASSSSGQGFVIDIVPAGLSSRTFVSRGLSRALEALPLGKIPISEDDPIWDAFSFRGIRPPAARIFDQVELFLEVPGLGHRAPVQAVVLDDPEIDFVLAGGDVFTEQYAFIPKGTERGLAFSPFPSPAIFTVSTDAAGAVHLRWADMGGDARYIVEQAPSVSGPWLPAPNVEWPIAATGVRLQGPLGRSLYLRVRALNWRPF